MTFWRVCAIGFVVFVVVAAVVIVVGMYAVVVEPSALEWSGHCYRVEARSGILQLAGTRRTEIPCP